MEFLWYSLAVIAFLAVAVFAAALTCFLKVFYSPSRSKSDEIQTPEGPVYEPYREIMVEWIKSMRSMPHTDVSVHSFDGLVLRGKYYEYGERAPIELLFHGYKSNSERDLCGAVTRCFSIGHSALVVDHRASGQSEGHVITFGVNESRDCQTWVNYILENIDADATIILAGISMGAATVMSCASADLPDNVIGIVADCGYTSAEQIIKKVMRDMHLPPNLLYPFVKLGARVFGKFDIDGISPIKALSSSRLPVIFFHGDTDDFVPYSMSEENYNACTTRKRLVRVEGAGHGLCFMLAPETYLAELETFFGDTKAS
jgi:fermentation-respiration switch protein FrsA (DUF1100 family)